jgi:hypothetical protein
MAFGDGGIARWRIIYDELLSDMQIGDVLTYEAMGTVLGLDPEADRPALQQAAQRAGKEFLVNQKHALKVRANVGYEVVEPAKHIELAQKHQKKATRSLKRGHAQVANLDLTELPEDLRKVAGVMVMGFTAQMDFNRRFSAGQRRMEQVLSTLAESTERTADELAEMRERMARLEAYQQGQD